MQALILATGERDGLKALTSRTPAPLLPIAGRPIMAIVVEQLVRAGITDHLVCLHDRSGAVEAYFGDGLRWGARNTYLPQAEPLGSAGSLRWAASQIRETCIVVPADMLVELDLAAALAFHQRSGGMVTMIVAPEAGHPGGGVRFGPDGRVEQLSDLGGRAPVGVYLVEPGVAAAIPAGRSVDLAADTLPGLLAAGHPVYAYVADGGWNPLSTPGEYAAAQRSAIDRSAAPEGAAEASAVGQVAGRQIGAGVWVGRNHAIHPTARIIPPVVIGDNCQIGRDVELGPYTVIGDGCILSDGCTVQESAILPHTFVGRLVAVERRIVDASVMVDIESGSQVEMADAFLLGPASPDSFGSLTRSIGDALVASLLLVLMLPAMLVIAALSLIASRGQIVVRETRVIGRSMSAGGQESLRALAMLRFATRRPGRPAGWLGRQIERTELDHIPALWHVARGELALVGIKPLMPDDAAQVQEPWQIQRYEQPAGLTGLWYVQPERDSGLSDVLIADAYYVATRTIGGDLRLIAQTPGAWLRRTSQPHGRAAGHVVPSQVRS